MATDLPKTIPVALLLAVALLLVGCSRTTATTTPTTAPTLVRVEYPNPGEPVTVRAVPADQLTPVCIERTGVLMVRDAGERTGYAEADAFTATVPECHPTPSLPRQDHQLLRSQQ